MKNVQLMATPTNHASARAGCTLHGASGAEPLALWDFRNIFSQIQVKTKKRISYDLSAGLLAECHMLNRPWLLHYVYKKVR